MACFPLFCKTASKGHWVYIWFYIFNAMHSIGRTIQVKVWANGGLIIVLLFFVIISHNFTTGKLGLYI